MTIYYDVPDLPGVPPMLRNPAAPARALFQQADAIVVDFQARAAGIASNVGGAITSGLGSLLGTSNDIGGTDNTTSDAWGVFDDSGQKVINPDTFLGIEFRSSTRISNYPLEEGAFENYNKVNDPYDVVIGLACGGDVARRTDFLETAKTIAGTLDLYTIVTPEQVFESVNIERYDFKRSERNGVGLITVNLFFKEIRINSETEFTSTPDNAPTVEEAQSATTAESADTARASDPLDAAQVKNPASASPLSQGQTQAEPATPDQAAPAPTIRASTDADGMFGAPTGGPLTVLPSGYTQERDTGLIRGPDGKVDRQMTINQGTSYIGG